MGFGRKRQQEERAMQDTLSNGVLRAWALIETPAQFQVYRTKRAGAGGGGIVRGAAENSGGLDGNALEYRRSVLAIPYQFSGFSRKQLWREGRIPSLEELAWRALWLFRRGLSITAAPPPYLHLHRLSVGSFMSLLGLC